MDRTSLAMRVLQGLVVEPTTVSYHLWLPLAAREVDRVFKKAPGVGLQLTDPASTCVDPETPGGLRLCLGGVDRSDLEGALLALRGIVEA